jgi:hypothetical protein
MKHHDLVQDLEVGVTRLTSVSVYLIQCKRIWKLCPLSKDAMPMCPRPMCPRTLALGQCVLYISCPLDDASRTYVSRLWTSYMQVTNNHKTCHPLHDSQPNTACIYGVRFLINSLIFVKEPYPI